MMWCGMYEFSYGWWGSSLAVSRGGCTHNVSARAAILCFDALRWETHELERLVPQAEASDEKRAQPPAMAVSTTLPLAARAEAAAAVAVQAGDKKLERPEISIAAQAAADAAEARAAEAAAARVAPEPEAPA